MIDVVTTLAGPWADGTRPKDLFALHIAADSAAYVPDIVVGIRDGKGKAQAGCAELASLVSEQNAEVLWPHCDLFAGNLSARQPVVRWEAVCVLGNLAALDAGRELVPCIPDIEAQLTHASIVLQGHSVRALGKMARAYPGEAAGILEALTASAAGFPGTRVGYLVEVMGAFADDPVVRPAARAFAEPYVHCGLPSVAAKARKAMRALGG